MALEALQYEDTAEAAHFKLLDQRELPLRTLYIDIPGPKAAFDAIKVIAMSKKCSKLFDFNITSITEHFGLGIHARACDP